MCFAPGKPQRNQRDIEAQKNGPQAPSTPTGPGSILRMEEFCLEPVAQQEEFEISCQGTRCA